MLNIRNVQPAAGKPGTPFMASLCVDNRRVAVIKATKTGVAFEWSDPAAEPALKGLAKTNKTTPEAWATREAERARIVASLRKRMFKVLRLKCLFFIDGKPHTTDNKPAAAAKFLAEHPGAERVGADLTVEQGLDLFVAHYAPTAGTVPRVDLTTGLAKSDKAADKAAGRRKATTKAPARAGRAKPAPKAAQAAPKAKTRIPDDVPRTPSGQKSRAKKYRVAA